MENIQRCSPVALPGEAKSVRNMDGWSIITEYAGESGGPFAVDLSHIGKWDLQCGRLDEARPWGLEPPRTPGECRLMDGRLLMRLNPSQAAVWDLGGHAFSPPGDPNVTDVSEASAMLAVLGAQAPAVLEKLSDLDLDRPGLPAAKLWQAPVCRIPCRVVRLLAADGTPAIILAFSSGYGRDMTSALFEAGREFGLQPGGEKRWTGFL